MTKIKSEESRKFINARTHTDNNDLNNIGMPWQSVSKSNAERAIEIAESNAKERAIKVFTDFIKSDPNYDPDTAVNYFTKHYDNEK